MTTPKPRALEVVRIEDRAVVQTVDVTGRGEHEIERVLAGMLINSDTDRYFIRDSWDAEPREEARTG